MEVIEMARLGGKARAAKLNGKQRSEIARKAARALGQAVQGEAAHLTYIQGRELQWVDLMVRLR